VATDDLPRDVVALSPDGSWLATARADGRVDVLGSDGSTRARLAAPGPVTCIAMSSDGTHLAVAGRDFVHVWSADGTPRRTRRTGLQRPCALTLGAGRGRIAVLDVAEGLRLLDSDGACCHVVTPPDARCVVIAKDESWIATSHGHLVIVWDADGALRATLHVWVPRILSRSCDLHVLVYEAAE
jgi:hypothetical protein